MVQGQEKQRHQHDSGMFQSKSRTHTIRNPFWTLLSVTEAIKEHASLFFFSVSRCCSTVSSQTDASLREVAWGKNSCFPNRHDFQIHRKYINLYRRDTSPRSSCMLNPAVPVFASPRFLSLPPTLCVIVLTSASGSG